MPAPKPRNTEEELARIEIAKALLQQAAAGGGFRLAREDFEQARHLFGRRVYELDDLVSSWRMLGEYPPPLGDNPVGKAVADRFVAMTGRFVGTLGDYRGKLGEAHGTVGEVLRDATAVENAVIDNFTKLMGGGSASIAADDAVALLGEFGFSTVRWDEHVSDRAAAEWSPAAKVDWRTYTSQQLYDFATVGNNPETVFSSIGEWQSKEDTLKMSTSGFKSEIGRLMAAWQGGAANAAEGALVPLAEWGNDAAGNANRLHRDLEKAGDAAARLRGMPGPVEEPSMFEMLHTGLLGSPAEVADMQQRVQHAQQVKADQVRYMEQYESTMTSVYDSLPNFHLAPVAVGDDPGGPPAPRPPDPGGPGNPIAVPPGRSPAESQQPAVVGADTPGPRDGTGDHRLPGVAAGTVTSAATDLATLPPGGLPAPSTGEGGASRGGSLGVGGFVAGNQGFSSGNQGRTGGNLGQGRGPGEGRGTGGPNRGLTPAAAEGPPGAARRGAGTVPGGGTPGKRSAAAEDIEHERPSYLVERDPQGLFGTDERTAPPVIGGRE